MLKQKTEIVKIGEKTFRLSKLNARDASYLALKLAAIVAPGAAKGEVDIAQAVTKINRAEFDELQTMLLRTVSRMEQAGDVEMPVPIVKADGTFTDEELEYDIPTVFGLTIKAIMFNVGSFFQGGALTQILK